MNNIDNNCMLLYELHVVCLTAAVQTHIGTRRGENV